MRPGTIIHPLAGKPASRDRLIDIGTLRNAYYMRKPDVMDRSQRVRFGPGGHRGESLRGAFNEAHVLAITQAICDYRLSQGITGPTFIGRDTHALSEPAFTTALEVLAGNSVEAIVDSHGGYTPTPALSHAVLRHNISRTAGLADSIIITPSQNPPEDGGIKYNPPHGGPPSDDVTRWIENKANWLLSSDLRNVARIAYERARRAATIHTYDYVGAYVNDLGSVVDMEAIRGARLSVGVDPLGGAGVVVWRPIVERWGIDIEIVNDTVDSTFRFMPLDWDGTIRMDCSSPHAMARLIALKDRFDVAFGNDTDADRHGIITRDAGLMDPNHYLAAAVYYLGTHRRGWGADAAIGKTAVSSSMIDHIAARLGRAVVETPVGFRWYVTGLLSGSIAVAGDESAAASFLRRDGTVWVTEKDGIVMALLAMELMARTGRTPSELYAGLAPELGSVIRECIDAPATDEERAVLMTLSPGDVRATTLAGDPVEALFTSAAGNGAHLGGLKVVTAYGWFAAIPSGTDPVYKLYAESFRSAEHLKQIQDDASAVIGSVLAGAIG
jgi:phosphoglucomutase